MGKPIYSDEQILAERDRMVASGQSDVTPWAVFAAMGGKGKYKRFEALLSATPPDPGRFATSVDVTPLMSLSTEVTTRVDALLAEMSTAVLGVLKDVERDLLEKQQVDEATLKEAHQSQLAAMADRYRVVEAASAAQLERIVELETLTEALEAQVAEAETRAAQAEARAAALDDMARTRGLALEEGAIREEKLRAEHAVLEEAREAAEARAARLDNECMRLSAELERHDAAPAGDGIAVAEVSALPSVPDRRAARGRGARKGATEDARGDGAAGSATEAISKAGAEMGKTVDVPSAALDGDEPPLPGFAPAPAAVRDG